MGDARFFARSSPHALAAIAIAARGTAPAIDRTFLGVAPLQSAGPDQVSFLDNRRYAAALEHTMAGAVIVHPDMLRAGAQLRPYRSSPPRRTKDGRASRRCSIPRRRPVRASTRSAVIADTARVDPSAEIGPYVVIEAGAEIGPGCRIGAFVSIGKGVTIGADCRIGAHVSLSHTLLGARVYIYPGARIGQEGFSFAATDTGFLSIPQLGRVIVEDDVEVGANTTIDRGSTHDTVIGAGSRIDNLVQIGHNVQLGRCCVIVAQVGIAGSTILEDFVQVGGQAAMAGHLRIGQGAQIGAQAGVISDTPAGAVLLGSPAQPRKEFFRQVIALKRMIRKAQ